MISKDSTKSVIWGEWPEATQNQWDAFTANCRTNREPTRNDPRSCKTPLRVAAVQLPRLDREDRAALRKYVERDMGR
jgi:hypothetical protein